MIIDRLLTKDFVTFIKSKFATELSESVVKGELYRGMFQGRLMVLREHDPDDEEAETIEVFFADKNALSKVEEEFHIMIGNEALMSMEEGNETDGS